MADEKRTDEDFIERALKRFKLAATAETPQRNREQEDLAWQTPEGQWPDDVKQARLAQGPGSPGYAGIPIPARPMLSIAPVTEPIDLVSNQQRSAHLECYFHPLSEDATDDTAEVLQGLYRHGGKFGAAVQARNWAYDRALWCGRGWYRLDTVYDPEGGHALDQKIIWRKILYQGSVYVDPFAADPCDWMWAFVCEDVPFDRYQQLYPDSELASYDDDDLRSIGDEAPSWIGGDDEVSRTVRVAEYWRVELGKETHHLLDDGNLAPDDKIPAGRTKLTGDEARSREIETRTLYWSKINCKETLEPEVDRDGKYIPLMQVIGHELQPFEGKRRWIGMIANAKDGARLTNYAASGAVELAALEPRAPFELDPKQIEGYEAYWQQSNTRNFPYLPFHSQRDGIPFQPPARVQIDVGRLGPNMTLLSMGRDFVQSAMATYDPALGKQPTAHRSGKALEALQGQTVEATSHYLDNFANYTLNYEALVWLDLAPHVYDRPGRVVKILDMEDKAQSVMLNAPFRRDPNTQQPQAVNLPPGMPPQQAAADMRNPVKHFDLKKGSYGITVTIGKSSASRLQQGSDEMGAILQADPALMPIVGPEYFKFRDFPGARTIAELLKKMRDHTMPWLSEDQQNQIPPHAQQQMQAMSQQLQQAVDYIKTEQAKHQAQIQMEQIKQSAAVEMQKMKDATSIAVATINARAKGVQSANELQLDAIALAQEAQQAPLDRQHELNLAQQQQAHDAQQSQQSQAHDVGMGAMQGGQDQQAAAQAHQQALEQQAQGQQGDQQLAAQQAAVAPQGESA